MRLRSNKKGASIDNIFAAILMFGMAIFFITMALFWNVMNDQVDDFWDRNPSTTQIQNNAQALSEQFDFIFITIWVGIHLGILTTAFLLRSHPVIYVASLFIIAILAMIAAPVSNAYVDLNTETEISTAMDELVMTNFIMENLPKLEIIWGFVTAVVMFGLARLEGFV